MVVVHAAVDMDAFQANLGITMDCDEAQRLAKTLQRELSR